MRQVFQQELSELQQRLVEIAELVQRAIADATTAFNESDLELAEKVIEQDATIDDLTRGLDEMSIRILARQQPVARDLRVVVSALRISASLERMGDIAEHIATLTRYRFPERVVAKGVRGTFRKMGDLDVQIAEKLVKLLKKQDLAIVNKIRDIDDEIDALHVKVFGKVLDEAWGGTTADTVDATLASRYHERFGDHAVSIARMVAYLSTGDWSGNTEE